MKNEIAIKEKSVVDSVLIRINSFKESGEIKIPPDYSPENALKSAWLILQETKDRDGKLALEICTKESIANSLFDMVTQGLSPIKKQCYFVIYGKKLTLIRSYMGSIAQAKRYGNVKDVVANVIYEKDEFDFEIEVETGKKKILKHKQTLESLDGKIIGAYAVVTTNDSKYIEIMSIQQIKSSWNQGQMKGGSPAHKNFESEMAKKSVINRACKLFINTSSDAILFDEEEFETTDHAETRVRYEISDNSNKGEILSIDDINVVDTPPVITKSPNTKTPSIQDENVPMAGQITMETAILLEPGF